jgi:hypothetical protein
VAAAAKDGQAKKGKKGKKGNGHKGDKKAADHKGDKRAADHKGDKKAADRKGDRKAAPKGQLSGPRPALDAAWRAPTTTFLPGAMTLNIAMPKDKVPLYKPLELRLAVDHGPTALVVASASVTITPMGSAKPLGKVDGKPSAKDGRVAITLLPLPTPVEYLLDVEYAVASGDKGRVSLIYDAAASELKTP